MPFRIRPGSPLFASLFLALVASSAHAQVGTPAQSFHAQFVDVNRRILGMAKDWPADKYGYRATRDVRSFGEVIVHVASGNFYAAKAGRGEKAEWTELDPKKYNGKAAIVALLEKSINDATAALKATPDDRFTKTVEPWLDVIEHAGEHYGQLVVYYRNNGMVPPESRPKK
ncbi:MAG TPA: DinB family protein [Bryobacteraceae bacterium]|nr:DinB family protein [Bryobacteraceae bacterium]